MDATKQIEELVKLSRDYYECPPEDGHAMMCIAQKMSAIMAFLETIRSEVHNEFQLRINKLVHEEKWSVAKADNQAHVDFPLMYKLRRVMDGHKQVLDIIRSQVSNLKTEKNNKF